MTLPEKDVPTWTAGWTAGYAAGIKRALADCPTHGVCPNCREGWGHYTYEYGYLPTTQSVGTGNKASSVKLACLMEGCPKDAALGGWCEDHQ